jgi:glycosyltransferase involved in cell wall biosynthesis
MRPCISVLIPTYERPDLLTETLASALAQDADDFEIVVGDDGTSGEAVVSAFADDRVVYLQNCPRLGLAGNWNMLLDRARGEYMTLLMDDDRLLPEFLPKCLAAFARMPDLGVAFTNHLFDTGGRITHRRCHLAHGRHDDFSYELMRLKPVAVSAALIRRSTWEAVRPLPDTAAADMVLFGRIADRGWPFYYIDEPLMIYRSHENMLSSTPGFRSETIKAWESLRFDDREAERLRQTRLADALLSRASQSLRQGELSSAREDIARARTFKPSSHLRLKLVSILSNHYWAAWLAGRGASLTSWRPWP